MILLVNFGGSPGLSWFSSPGLYHGSAGSCLVAAGGCMIQDGLTCQLVDRLSVIWAGLCWDTSCLLHVTSQVCFHGGLWVPRTAEE